MSETCCEVDGSPRCNDCPMGPLRACPMTEPTDADRKRAADLIWGHLPAKQVEAVARALTGAKKAGRDEALAEIGTCGDLSPAFNAGSGVLAPAMCDLPPGHLGAHRASDGSPFPMRWIRPPVEHTP